MIMLFVFGVEKLVDGIWVAVSKEGTKADRRLYGERDFLGNAWPAHPVQQGFFGLYPVELDPMPIRGLPEDISDAVAAYYENYGRDCSRESWCTVAELKTTMIGLEVGMEANNYPELERPVVEATMAMKELRDGPTTRFPWLMEVVKTIIRREPEYRDEHLRVISWFQEEPEWPA